MSTFILYILIGIICLLTLKLYLKLTTGWCRSQILLVGKTVIITGANTGIGYETAADLAKRGAKVILACRNEDKAKQATKRLKDETNNPNISYKVLDLCSFESVRKFAQDINDSEERLDILINNAGLYAVPKIASSDDGLQPVMQANYFGHFLLTNLLLDLLKKSNPSRVVNVASLVGGFTPLNLNNLNANPFLLKNSVTYGRSKLCNILFTIELEKRIKTTGVTTYSLHPGVIATEFITDIPAFIKVIINFIIKWFFKDSAEGAQTTIYCAVAKDIEKYSGQHFHDCHVVSKYLTARNKDLPKELWQKTEELVKLNDPQKVGTFVVLQGVQVRG